MELSTLPPEIGELTNLKRLDLTNLNLSKLPIEMKKLKNLNTLKLNGNPDLNIQKRILKKIPKYILEYFFEGE